jgi:hypothetical protein
MSCKSLAGLAAGIGIAGIAVGASATDYHEHSEEHLAAFEELCWSGPADEAFCACALEAVQRHLPPEYVSLEACVMCGDSEEHDHFFSVHEDLPTHAAHDVEDAVIACRDEHVDLEDVDEDFPRHRP